MGREGGRGRGEGMGWSGSGNDEGGGGREGVRRMRRGKE